MVNTRNSVKYWLCIKLKYNHTQHSYQIKCRISTNSPERASNICSAVRSIDYMHKHIHSVRGGVRVREGEWKRKRKRGRRGTRREKEREWRRKRETDRQTKLAVDRNKFKMDKAGSGPLHVHLQQESVGEACGWIPHEPQCKYSRSNCIHGQFVAFLA